MANKYVFKCRLNVDSDGDDVTNDGRLMGRSSEVFPSPGLPTSSRGLIAKSQIFCFYFTAVLPSGQPLKCLGVRLNV